MHKVILISLFIFGFACKTMGDINTGDSEGWCTRQISEMKTVSESFTVTCIGSRRTCWGLTWKFGINCTERTYQTYCLKQRQVGRLTYKEVDVCCPGYIISNNTCIKGCDAGKYGRYCNLTCNCNQTENMSGNCDTDTGDCYCKAGWNPPNCTQTCGNSTYGVGCKQKCGCNIEGTKKCNPADGTCECVPGNTGDLCNIYCPNGTYGEGCSSKCNCSRNSEYCRPSDGKCIEICMCNKAGTDNCDELSEDCTCAGKSFDTANPTEYQEKKCNTSYLTYDKENILNRCACRQQNDKLCVAISGICICKPGYAGIWCNEEIITGDTLDADRREMITIGGIIGGIVALMSLLAVVVVFRKTSCLKSNTPVSESVLPVQTYQQLNRNIDGVSGGEEYVIPVQSHHADPAFNHGVPAEQYEQLNRNVDGTSCADVYDALTNRDYDYALPPSRNVTDPGRIPKHDGK